MKWFEKYKVDVPEGKSGKWRIERFEMTDTDATKTAFTAMQHGRGYCPAGTYTRLVRGGCLVMSDTPDEIDDHRDFIINAEGDVLVAGLGIGVVLQGLLRKGSVNHVTVVEKSTDVINLVKDHYEQKFDTERFEVIHADIFEWRPPRGQKWDFAWFDIWDEICSSNRPEFTKLRRKFGKRCPDKQFWCEWRVERMYREDQEWKRRTRIYLRG